MSGAQRIHDSEFLIKRAKHHSIGTTNFANFVYPWRLKLTQIFFRFGKNQSLHRFLQIRLSASCRWWNRVGTCGDVIFGIG